MFAAPDIATGEVIGDLHKTHTPKDFVALLNKISHNIGAGADVHIVLDNLSAHKTPPVHRRLLHHQHPVNNPVTELATDITTRAERRNDGPKSFTWHESADQILGRSTGYRPTLTNTEHIDSST